MSAVNFESKSEIRAFYTRFQEAMKSFAEEEGVAAVFDQRSFQMGADGTEFKVKFGPIGEIESKHEKNFKLYASMHGIDVSRLGTKFMSSGKCYTLIGYRPQAERYPFVCRAANGKIFHLTDYSVRSGLGLPLQPSKFPNVRLPFPQGL